MCVGFCDSQMDFEVAMFVPERNYLTLRKRQVHTLVKHR